MILYFLFKLVMERNRYILILRTTQIAARLWIDLCNTNDFKTGFHNRYYDCLSVCIRSTVMKILAPCISMNFFSLCLLVKVVLFFITRDQR